MKKKLHKIISMFLAAALLCSPLPITFAEQSGEDQQELTNFVGVNGTWVSDNGELRGNNRSIGDSFAINSSAYVRSDQAFTYEVAFTINDGVAGGAVFGVVDPKNPSATWYCANIDKSDSARNSRIFGVSGGGLVFEKGRKLTNEELDTSSYTIKIVYDGEGKISSWLNGNVVVNNESFKFAGGYFGLLTWFSDVTYRSAKLTISDPDGDQPSGALVQPGELIAVDGSSAYGSSTEGYTLDGVGRESNMAILNNRLDSLTFSANMKFTDGNGSGGLIFGVENKNTAAGQHFALMIDKSENEVKLLTKDSQGEETLKTMSVPDSTDISQDVSLKITVDQNDLLKVYIGNMYIPIITKECTAYQGGYIGFMTKDASAKFTDIKIYSGEPADPLDSYPLTELSMGEIHSDHVTVSDGAYTLSKINANTMAVFDAYTTAMEFEADLEILSGSTAAGLMFGVEGTSNFGTNWSAVHIQPDRNNTLRVFCESNYNALNGLDSGHIALPAGTSSAKMHIKITITLSNLLKVYVNDMESAVYETHLSDYSGGYVGIMTYNTEAKFSNITLKGVTFPTLDSLEISEGAIVEQISADRYEYTATVAGATDEIRIKAESSDGDVYVGGKLLEKGSYSQPVPLVTGDNTVWVLLTSADGLLSRSVKIVINKPYNYDDPYNEIFRPQFHYTSLQYWVNDPNGLVYNAETGLYHMFYQYNPCVLYHDGQSHWGHAVSSDLIHWTQLPTALYPDKVGIMASGSAVIDRNNTSGLFDENTPPESRMVAIFTYFANGSDPGVGGAQRQAIAYSTDGGLTWTKYEGNSVIPNTGNRYGTDFRDPKVIWMEDTNEWLMIVAGGMARIFTSPDLIHWTHNGSLSFANGSAVYSECPDLFPLAVDGDESNIKWVYSGSGVFYIIGDLVKTDGKYEFVAQTDSIPFYLGGAGGGSGSDLYATQTFSNTPDGRTILISWIPEQTAQQLQQYGKVWNGSFSMPLEAKLVTVNGELRLATYPIEEINTLRKEVIYEASNLAVSQDDENILAGISGTLLDIEADITINGATEFGFNLRTGDGCKTTVKYNVRTKTLTVDKSASGVLNTGIKTMSVVPVDANRIKLRIMVDSSVIDVFANDGLTTTSTVFFPDPDCVGMEFYTLRGDVTINSLTVYDMSSIWADAVATPTPPYLTDITVSEGKLTEKFDPTVSEHTVIVPKGTESVDLGVIYADAVSVNCKINGNQVAVGECVKINLSSDETTVSVIVADKEGQREYTVTVIRRDEQQVDDDLDNTNNGSTDETPKDNDGKIEKWLIPTLIGVAVLAGAAVLATVFIKKKNKKEHDQ